MIWQGLGCCDKKLFYPFVEDNELNAEIATEILEMTGIAVEHADDGTKVLDLHVLAKTLNKWLQK